MYVDVLLKIACAFLLVAVHLYLDWSLIARPYSWIAEFPSVHLGTKLEFNLKCLRMYSVAFAINLIALVVLAIQDAEFPQGRLYAAFICYASCILMLWYAECHFAQRILNLGSCTLAVAVCVHTCVMDAPVFYVGAQPRLVARIGIAIIASDGRLALIQQIMFALVNLGRHLELGQATFGVSPLGQAIQAEFFQAVYIWVATFLFDSYRSARSDARVSACEAWASKRLLSVLCDADVQLNADLEIVGPCCRLSQFVNPNKKSRNSTLDMIRFTDLVAHDDKSRFEEFIRASPFGDMEIASPPVSSIHLCMICAEGLHVDVQLIHIPIYADGLPSHVLGILVGGDPGSRALNDATIEHHRSTWTFDHARTQNELPRGMQSSKSSGSTSSSCSPSLYDFETFPDISQVTLAIDPFADEKVQVKSVSFLLSETANGPQLLEYVRRSQRGKFEMWLQTEVNNAAIFEMHSPRLNTARNVEFKNLQLNLGVFRIAVDETRLIASSDEEEACLEIELVGIRHKPARKLSHKNKLDTIEELGMRRRRCIDPNCHF